MKNYLAKISQNWKVYSIYIHMIGSDVKQLRVVSVCNQNINGHTLSQILNNSSNESSLILFFNFYLML